MKMVKVLRDCILGKKGAVVQVADHIAKARIADGAVEEVKPKKSKRNTSNKALTAPSKG